MSAAEVLSGQSSQCAFGGVPERSNGAVLKTVGRASVPWVRIPAPPLRITYLYVTLRVRAFEKKYLQN